MKKSKLTLVAVVLSGSLLFSSCVESLLIKKEMKLIIRFHLLFVLLYMLLTSGKHQVAHSSLTGSHHALSIQCNVHFFTVRQEQVSSAVVVHL